MGLLGVYGEDKNKKVQEFLGRKPVRKALTVWKFFMINGYPVPMIAFNESWDLVQAIVTKGFKAKEIEVYLYEVTIEELNSLYSVFSTNYHIQQVPIFKENGWYTFCDMFEKTPEFIWNIILKM